MAAMRKHFLILMEKALQVKNIIMKHLLLLVLMLTLTWLSCKSPTATNNYRLSLSISDVSCTEAWIELTINNAPLPTNIVIKKNGNIFFSFNLTSNDTTLYDSTLSPNQSYSYQAEYGKGFPTERSETVTAKTMDTTSSSFTWQTFTFGGNAGSCMLNDVAIINDTLAYAVGEIYMNDSTGKHDPFPYNFAKWNGRKWQLRKIAVMYKGNQTIAPLKGVFILQNGEIILSSGLPYLQDNNGGWRLYHLWDMGVLNQNDGSVYHISGTSINDLFFVGNSGTIVHYSNGTWQKRESGTTLNITDIYGIPNTTDIFMSLYNTSSGLEGYDLLSIANNNKIENLSTPNNLFEASSVWAENKNIVYIAGSGLFRESYGKWEEINEFTMKSLTGIRANGLNDMFVIGSTHTGHYNGNTWTIYKELDLPNGVYSSIDFKNNVVIIAGYIGSRAVVTIGKR